MRQLFNKHEMRQLLLTHDQANNCQLPYEEDRQRLWAELQQSGYKFSVSFLMLLCYM